MMEPADWDRVFVADFAAERGRLGEANVMGFGRRAGQTTQGWVVGNVQCSLRRKRIVSAASRRRTGAVPVRVTGGAGSVQLISTSRTART